MKTAILALPFISIMILFCIILFAYHRCKNYEHPFNGGKIDVKEKQKEKHIEFFQV